MNTLDLIVLFGTLLSIVAYGVYKTRGQNNIEGYLLGNNSLGWGTIGLSVMATQASAITFISTPGQGYESGMGFVQNYFGLPIALIIVSAVFIPIFYKLKVYTAYEFLESRFDLKTRMLGALLFLIQRGLAAGITIYAPAIILSSILDWDLTMTIFITGGLVIVYTVSGGTRAVSITQKQQMAVIMIGMFVTFGVIVAYITDYVSFGSALEIAGKLDKLNTVDFDFNVEKRYTVWSGLTGGLFLALSYFGTDQSQVQRYLGGKNITESRMGLMFNAILKIPMQFFILLTGVMVYVFFIFYTPPVHFKDVSVQKLNGTPYELQYQELSVNYEQLLEERKNQALLYAQEPTELNEAKLLASDQASRELRQEVKDLLVQADPTIETKDSDYVFLTFILTYLPHGLIGLLIAVIFSAAMSSSSSEINSLSSTTTVDIYRRLLSKGESKNDMLITKGLTLLWGILAISFAILAKNSENLIEAVNIVGSIFYGTILGIFLVAFFLKKVGGNAVFWAAIISQTVVIVFHFLTVYEVITLGYLWYNAIGCLLTIILSLIIQIADHSK
ncbi:MAG: sodium:solute symporter [Flammeovirgaceae bacterium]|nr:sodium:solute symporter [Flammeovirgaceae bacterium]MBR06476.1 sodium:solute symporter [Rickettsiales bacterium]|tara:strand:+ start:3660 stop:5336 length:1677 start_codon:yes stop_codon:yes gene_type:complete